MIKTLNNTIKQDRTAYKIPRSVQDIIPIQRIFADGIFQFGTKYSRTLRFSDINYAIASKEDKTAMFLGYSELLFQHEYSANFLFTLWKRMRKYGACGTGLTQNVDDLLQSHTARTMLANSEFLLMLNQASTDRIELARLLNISDNQLSYISGVDFGHGLLKCGSTIVPFVDHFPKNGRLYQLMTTKMSERVEQAS